MKKILLSLAIFVVAFGVLSVSVIHSASISYSFATPTPQSGAQTRNKVLEVDYTFPYLGKVLPDNPLWEVKTLRDRVWYLVTTDPLKKAELALLFADKRLLAAKALFEAKKPDIALSTLSKGEKYLEIAANQEIVARNKGLDTSLFLNKLALSSLKHRQIIEENIIPLSPEDAKPEVAKVEDYSKNAYKTSRDALNSKGIAVPKNPFTDQ